MYIKFTDTKICFLQDSTQKLNDFVATQFAGLFLHLQNGNAEIILEKLPECLSGFIKCYVVAGFGNVYQPEWFYGAAVFGCLHEYRS